MKKLINILTSSVAVAALAFLALGLANTARAQVVPYTTDAHTLHLYHFDGAAGTGSVSDVGSGSPLINLIDVQGSAASTTASTAGTGSAGFTGFGNSFHPGPSQTDGHMAGGTGTTTVGHYANAGNFCGADGSFTLEAIVNVSSITAGTPSDSSKCIIIGRDGPNSSGRGYDLYIDSGKLAFYYYNGSSDVTDQTAIPTTGTDGWSAANWYHAAATYDHATKTLKLYWTKLNGKVTSGADLLSTFTITGNDPTTYGNNFFTVGSSARDPNNSGNWDRELPGYVDEARISDIARAASDMLPTGAALTATTTTVATSGSPSVFGNSVTFTATIAPASGSVVPTGTVQFKVDGTALNSPVTVTTGTSPNGTAATSTTTITVLGSPHVVTAEYTASGSFSSSTGTLAGGQSVTGPLTASAGPATNASPSVPSVLIGGSPTAVGGTSPYTYSWSPSTGLSSTTVANPTATPGVTRTYTVTVTDSATPQATATASVVVTYTVPALVASAGSPKNVTPSSPTVTIGGSPTASGGTLVYTYSWSPSTGLSDATVANPTATPGATRTYTVTVTDSASTTATASVVVTYTVPALVASAGSPQTVSPLASSVTIGGSPTASGGTAIYTYSWTPTTGLSSPSVANPTASPTVTTTYTVTVTDSASSTATASVVVSYLTPNAKLISVDFVYDGLGGANGGISAPCSGDTVLTGTTMNNAAGNIFTGQVGPWNSLDVGGNNANNSSATTGFLTNGAGVVTTVKLALGTATGMTPGGVWRNNYVSGLTGGTGATLRAEQSYLYYPGLLSTNRYAWAITGLKVSTPYMLTFFGSGPSALTTSNIAFLGTSQALPAVRDSELDWNWTSITSDASGTISGYFLDTGNNVTVGLYGMQLQELVPPLAASAGSAQSVSALAPSTTIGGSPTASGGTSPYTYSWTPSGSLNSATAANPTASPTTTTTYNVTVTDSASATATASVVVTYLLPVLTANAGSPQTITPSAPSATIGDSPTATGGTGPYTYSWTPTTGLSSATVANPTASPIDTTTYTVTVTDSLSATATASVVITYSAPTLVASAGTAHTVTPSVPSATIGGSPTATGGRPGYTYSWSPTTALSDATAPNPTASPTATTTYTVTVTDSRSTTATASVVITYTVPPLVVSAGSAQTVAAIAPSVTIGGSPTASGGKPGYTYSWSPTTALSDATAANPTASPTTTTTYTVTVTDSLSTTATASVIVTYAVPDPALISVDFVEGGSGGDGSGVTKPCVDNTVLTSGAMKNAVGNVFSGQVGPWNALNIGTYSQVSATSGFLKNGSGATTTVKLALGLATGLGATPAGGWRCSPNEGTPGTVQQLRSTEAYLYNGVITGDHFAWAFTGLTPNSVYKLVFFGDNASNAGASNVANGVAGTLDSEGDWNWTSLTADGSGTILGTFTAPNPTLGLYGAQLYKLNSPPVASDLTMGAISGQPATLPIIGGKHSPTDPDNDPLTVTAVGPAANGTATTDGTNVTYTSGSTFVGTNTFTYTVSDNWGGLATNMVTVTVTSNGQNGEGFTLVSADLTGMKYAGIPGFSYALEHSPVLEPPVWTPVATNVASTLNGVLSFTNTATGFYRVRWVP